MTRNQVTQVAVPPCPLLVIGGSAKSNATHLPEWQGYQCGLILAVQPAMPIGQAIRTAATYQSPPHLCPPSDPSFIFKAASLANDKLYVCTQTEILIYRISDLKILHHISHPLFNDLHHVFPLSEETFLVAITGLDMVVEVDLAGCILRSWDVLEGSPSSRISSNVDYRRIPTTKPHRSHPNHLFVLENQIWVTRFIQRDAICLTDRDNRIDIGIGFPHDGIINDNRVYFTTVEGYVVVSCPDNQKNTDVFDLNEITPSAAPLGWCRGIKLVGEGQIIVGFSRFRPTKWQLGIDFIKSSLNSSWERCPSPTRLACYDLRKKRLEWEFSLEDYKMNAVFSIL